MGSNTKIDWATDTFNPWWGCSEVSPACDHCYARAMAKRWAPGCWGKDGSRRYFEDEHWDAPKRWNRKAAREGVRRRVFCGSMCDVFEMRRTADEDDAWISLHYLIEHTPNLDWLLLTKRPEHVRDCVHPSWNRNGFPRNVWLGVTAEDQQRADERVPLLLQIPARVRFVSVEPMLEKMHLLSYMDSGLSWVICGCESGPKSRPTPHDWVRALRDQCQEDGVPFFLKQLRANEDGTGPIVKMPELDGKVWDEVPR